MAPQTKREVPDQLKKILEQDKVMKGLLLYCPAVNAINYLTGKHSVRKAVSNGSDTRINY